MEVKPDIETLAKIKVVGVGGSGGAAINRMISFKFRGVEFVAINTDAQALQHSRAGVKLHIGTATTRGLGAGMDPELGRKSAEESRDEVKEVLKGADMVFLTCGLGGGTGTGAGPLVAELAREAGALTIAVVTKPFSFEGAQRKAVAEQGLDELADKVDTIITIPNDRLLQLIDKKTSLLEAFSIVDDVLRQGVQGIAELVTVPGLINVDFADVKAIMSGAGSALMGIGTASGENRAAEAAKAAIDSPLLELGIDGARGILFTITGGPDLTMYEVNEAARIITASADPNAKIIFGAVIDEAMKDELKVTVIATGFAQTSSPKKVSATPMVAPYTPSAFLRQERVATPPEPKHERESSEPGVFQERSLRSSPSKPKPPLREANTANQAVDDYDIPALIRRMLGM
ncbi:MAG: cell division protein FtsZ [Candidatus Veblenbacteria bacterium]|nr:cell division protein FtsZ [Candidatus Veblenbacteria bacterium]